ncbi:MAG TPA: hypothetical protein VEC16_07185 [Alphaproteobacteria bacterium]|nr:hypothetical protein [Alphaproteobacteria bacterium]
MYGYWYSVRQHYSFTSQELKELFLTALAFAFMISSHYEGLFQFVDSDLRLVISGSFVGFLIFSTIIVFLSLYIHVALQKLVGIRLGYFVKYNYWANGILLGLFLSIITFGRIPLIIPLSAFILPGSIVLEHIPKLRLGKFRYGINAKDIARVALMGPLSHVFIITFLGFIYFATGKNPIISRLIIANILLMMYSMLPVPRIDSPIRMDGATDGLGIFFYSRWVYVLCLLTFLFYGILVWVSSVFSFIGAFILALLTVVIYSITLKQAS